MKTKLSKHISGSSIFLIILFIAIGIFSIVRTYNSRNSINEVARIDVPLIESMTNIETHQLEQSINLERAVRFAEEIGRYPDAQKNFVYADSMFRSLASLVDVELLQTEDQVIGGINEATTDTQRIIMKDLLNAIKKMEKEHLGYERDALAALDLLINGDIDEGIREINIVEVKEDLFNKEVEKVLLHLELYTQEIVQKIEDQERTTLRLVVLFTCLFVMISIIIALISSAKTSIPIENLNQGAKNFGAGNKNVKVDTPPSGLTNELTTTFNEMVVKLTDAQEEIDQHMKFSYSSAHDLKAPITNLKVLLSRLDKEDDDYELLLESAQKSAEQMYTIIDALNDMNQLRDSLSAKQMLVKFEKTVKDVEASISTQMEVSKVIVTKWFAKCPEILYPPEHLKSILQNLLANSIKYSSPDRLLEIEIKTYEKDYRTLLEFKDNGIGFDSQMCGLEVLEPFKQLDTSKEGSGLGLYIIKTIVEHHNGYIQVDSEPDKGTTFTIALN